MCAEKQMDSREKDPTTPHQRLLSSLVVRPDDTVGTAAAASGGGATAAGSDYEPGEVRRDPTLYSRSGRSDGRGYRMRAGSVSPPRRRDTYHRYSPGFETLGGASRGHGFRNGREPGRYREYSPPYVRGQDGGQFPVRGFDQSLRVPGGPRPLRVEGLPRNNPNVRPREGDWICSDPLCKNLNFARREHCNNCNRPRYASSGSPRGGYLGPPFPPRHGIPPIPLDPSPVRGMNVGYRSPPRGWPSDAPREFRASPLPGRNEVRFSDPLMRGERHNFPEDDRFGYDRSPLPEWGHRDRGSDDYYNRRGYGNRFLSPPPASTVPPRSWASHIRDRSRSPVRGGGQTKYYQRDMHMNRRRDDRRGVGRDAF